MTLSYYADRMNLSRLLHLHPHWTQQQLADALGRWLAWVKKWLKRFREEVPPEGLRRVPGQKAIRYYLERDGALLFYQLPVPSAKTIYRILKAHDRILTHKKRVHQPVERPAPMTCWQIDFKDGSSVPAAPDG